MTITVRQLRRGTVVRLTGAHAQAFNGLLINLLDRAEAVVGVIEAAESPAKASERVPERSEITRRALGAGESLAASNDPQPERGA